MQVCTSLQTDNHASTPPLSFLQAGCPSCRPTNSVKALKALNWHRYGTIITSLSPDVVHESWPRTTAVSILCDVDRISFVVFTEMEKERKEYEAEKKWKSPCFSAAFALLLTVTLLSKFSYASGGCIGLPVAGGPPTAPELLSTRIQCEQILK